MKLSLITFAISVLLIGCETTTTSPQQHVYDQAATLADKKTTVVNAVPLKKQPAPKANVAVNSITGISRTEHPQDDFDLAASLGQSSYSTQPAVQPKSADLAQIIADSWRFRNNLNDDDQATDTATLADLSPAAFAAKNQIHLSYLKQLDQIDRSQLTIEQDINWQILYRQIKNLTDSYQFKQHYNPITSEYGFHIGLANISHQFSFNTVADYENYLSKLSQVKRQFKQQTDWMRQGLIKGYSQPKASLVGFESSITPYITDTAIDSVFYRPFAKISLPINANEKVKLQARATAIIEQQIIPAYRQFYDFMTQEYLIKARASVGVSAVPNGLDYYNNRIKYFTTLDLNADQVHQLGLKEVARIKAEMKEIIKQLNFKGNFSEFLTFLRTDPQFYATSPQQLLEKAAWLSKKADAILPKLFNKLPRAPYGVEAVPAAIAPKYTTGRYNGASNDNEASYYWVNTYALDKRPLYVLPALTLHEAVPGHHLQISLNKELKNLPDFRRQSYISAFGEGWGLYAEYLGVETNYYSTPYEQFGRLTYEMWRACRLVVDTGLHAKGWSRQQVLDYMAANTALSLHNITTETDRYITWPGQALSYKIGELTIKQLRKDAEQALGTQFDLKEFHAKILEQGSVPLPILKQQIAQYISEKI